MHVILLCCYVFVSNCSIVGDVQGVECTRQLYKEEFYTFCHFVMDSNKKTNFYSVNYLVVGSFHG